MSIEQQKAIWDKNWERQNQINPEHILNSRFTQEAYHSLSNFIDGKKDKLILEAGCGIGRFCCLLAEASPDSQVIGIDISTNAIEIANKMKEDLKLSNVYFKKGDLFKIPYPNDYFDVVFNEGVIEHFSLNENPNYKDAVKEMVRVTRIGGKVIIAVPNWYNFIHTFYKWILKIVGKRFKYGYEKSFKQDELLALYSDFEIEDVVLDGFFPSHGFYRLSGHSKIFNVLGRLIDMLKNSSFIRKFGFEIIIKGVKST